jgi:GNAT superfamily N-acetyltransferase
MHASLFPSIERVVPEEEPVVLPQLIQLLQDALASGASIGFLPPLQAEEAQQYWREVFLDVTQRLRVLLVARQAGQIVGSVQLALATNPNARHRAEVQKLLVLSSYRHRGIGRALMHGVEQAARDIGQRLLILNTVEGEPVERLYRSLGYSEVGVIPAYAYSAHGMLDTVIFYKTLSPVK